METLIAICGINCTQCPAYLATQNNDDAARARIASEWSDPPETVIKPEDINCDGCTVVKGRRISFADMCDVRACGIERKLESCGLCEDYPCDKLDKIFKMDSSAKDTLDGIKAARG